MRYDEDSNFNFNNACNELIHLIGNSYEKKLKEITDIINNEKMIYEKYNEALKKIKELEKKLNSQGHKIPNEILYRKAVILFEIKKKYDDSEEILLSIINNKDVKKWLIDRCNYYLCQIYADKFSDSDNESEKEILLAKGQLILDDLNRKAIERQIDETVLTWMSEIRKLYRRIEESKDYIVRIFPGLEATSFHLKKDAESKAEKSDIFIDFNLKKVLIKGVHKKLTDSNLKLLLMILRDQGVGLEDTNIFISPTRKTKDSKGNEFTENGFQKRISRLRKDFATLAIDILQTNDKKVRMSTQISVSILYNRNHFSYVELLDLLDIESEF